MVGSSGSGKSTLARELAVILDVPYLELDGVNHQPNWEPLATDEFRRIVAAKAAEDGWVIDGGSSTVQPRPAARPRVRRYQAATSSEGSAMTSTSAPLRITVMASGRPIASANIRRCRSWAVATS